MMLRILLLLSVCLLAAVEANRNYTIHHYVPGSNCQGQPFLIQEWSKPGPNDASCTTSNIASGTTPQNTPKAYQAFCEKQTLALLDSVNVLRVTFYYLRASCGFGSPEDEIPNTVQVGVPGFKCFKEKDLFEESAVRIYHDCQNDSIRPGYGILSLVLLAVACFQLL
jgi:hypothetical protein